MDESFSDRPNRLPWPPIIYLIAIVIAAVLSYTVPLPWVPSPFSDIALAAGVLMAIAAIAVDILAMRTMSAAKTTVMPHRGSEHLVTKGPFSFSRNPIYLGNTVLTIAIGLVFGALWFLPAGIAAAFATQKLAIEREEKHLAVKFGKPYRDYCKRVKRWI